MKYDVRIYLDGRTQSQAWLGLDGTGLKIVLECLARRGILSEDIDITERVPWKS